MSAYGPLARVYDELTGDVPYEEFADFYEDEFAKRGAQVKTILDLACGTGTLTCILAERGYELIAVDASADMLSVAREKAERLQGCVMPLLLCQELSALDLYGTVDAAVCCLDGMNYIPPRELPAVFRHLGLFVRPGGVLIFDILSPARLRGMDGQTFADETDDALCIWRAQYDERERALVYGMDIFTRQSNALWLREGEEHIEYAHEPSALKELLGSAGFRDFTEPDGPQSAEGRVFISCINTKDL